MLLARISLFSVCVFCFCFSSLVSRVSRFFPSAICVCVCVDLTNNRHLCPSFPYLMQQRQHWPTLALRRFCEISLISLPPSSSIEALLSSFFLSFFFTFPMSPRSCPLMFLYSLSFICLLKCHFRFVVHITTTVRSETAFVFVQVVRGPPPVCIDSLCCVEIELV